MPFVAGVILSKQIVIWPVGFGLMELAEQAPGVFAALKWASAAYICWLAWKVANMRLEAGRSIEKAPGFAAGLVAILGNPKAVLFYMGVLPGFFDLRDVTAVDVALIIAVSVAIPLIGNLILAACVGHIRGFITRPETLRRINLISGALLIIVGVVIPVL